VFDSLKEFINKPIFVQYYCDNTITLHIAKRIGLRFKYMWICDGMSAIGKKVLVVHPYFNDVGGAESVLFKILEALIERKHDCSLLGELPSSNIFGNLPVSDVKQIRYSKIAFKSERFQTHKRLLRHLKLKDNLRKGVGEMDLEISTQDPMYFIGSGKKRVAYIHFSENFIRMQKSYHKYRWFWKLYYWPYTFFLKHQIKKVDLLICNSLYTQRAIMNSWGREAELVYPPVDIDDFKPVNKEPFVISVGRFTPAKNYELVIEVARRLPTVRFVIVARKRSGDPYFDKIVALKPDNVDLIVDASRADVSALLGKAKIYLHSMIGEHFGISVVEAMAAGCIPVVHNSGGPKEVMGKGYVFLYNDLEECVKAIEAALQSDDVTLSDYVERAKMFSADNFKRNFVETLKRAGFL